MQTNSQNQKINNSYKKILNLTLIVLGSALLLLGIFLLFITVSSIYMPVGYGDIVFIAIPLMIMIGLVSVAYIIMVTIHLILQHKRELPSSKLHLIAAVVVLIIGLQPYFGPIRVLYGSSLHPVIELISNTFQDSNFKGPTAAQIAKANLESFDKAQALFDGCNVSSIKYWRYDIDGPFTEKNSYIIVGARNNGTDAYREAPPSINLLISNKDKVKNAIKDYSKGPYPACKENIYWNEGRLDR